MEDRLSKPQKKMELFYISGSSSSLKIAPIPTTLRTRGPEEFMANIRELILPIQNSLAQHKLFPMLNSREAIQVFSIWNGRKPVSYHKNVGLIGFTVLTFIGYTMKLTSWQPHMISFILSPLLWPFCKIINNMVQVHYLLHLKTNICRCSCNSMCTRCGTLCRCWNVCRSI